MVALLFLPGAEAGFELSAGVVAKTLGLPHGFDDGQAL